MAIVNGSLELGYKNTAWFAANPTLVLKEGQIVYLEQTGTYKIGNGVSTLSALSFLGVSSETQTLQNVTDLGSTTTNSITANSFIKSGGTASQFLKANGSVDSSTYASTTYVDSQDALKVDKVTGKGLSTNDYTTAEQTKLSGIATGAEVNVNADWNATSGDAQILNKPTIGVGDMTKAVYDVDNSGVVDNAEAIIIIGRNSTGSTLRKGTIIYILGSTGNRPNFVKAQANSESTSAGTFGVIVNDIANNTDGNCCVLGYLDTLDTRTTATYPFTTDTLADGDTIYLSPTNAGYITNVKPSAPNHLVYLGKVTRTSPTNGTIIYRIQNGYELEELHNVAIASVANNEILTYENSTSLWKNKTVVSALGFTPYNATNPSAYISEITSGMVTTALGFTPYNSTNPSGYITGITSGMVTTALGFTPYNSTNPSGYITSSALTPYAPIANPTFTTAITTPIVNGVSGAINFNNAVQTSGAITAFTFTKPNNTGQTLSTSIAGWNYNGGTRQWATGAITTQSENVWGATTYSFVGASTIVYAYGNVFNAPIAGTNATITNNYAGLFNGNVQIGSSNALVDIRQTATASNITQTASVSSSIYTVSGTLQVRMQSFAGGQNWLFATGGRFLYGTSDAQPLEFYTATTKRFEISAAGILNFYGATNYDNAVNITFGTTTGTKIATGTTQKLSFWNAVPIVQPTTSVTASTFVTNTSGILNDTATFDGYTIGQVVKALRNMGLLA